MFLSSGLVRMLINTFLSKKKFPILPQALRLFTSESESHLNPHCLIIPSPFLLMHSSPQ